MSEQPEHGWRRSVVAVLGLMLITLGLVVCVGWYVRSVSLVQVHADLAPMKFNTAFSFLLLGVSLTLWSVGRTRLSCVPAGLVAALCLATMLEHITGVSFGIDTIFVDPFTLTLTAHPGRMSHYAGWSFVALSSVLLVQCFAKRRGWVLAFGLGLCVGVMVLTCAALVGYAIGHRLPLSGGTNMAFHTALGFMMASWGALAVLWPEEEETYTGLANALLTLPIGATTLGTSLALFLLPFMASRGEGVEAKRPVGPVVAVLAITACITTAAVIAARVGFGRAAMLRRVNLLLEREIVRRERVESKQRLLVNELDHRVRNTLSQVLALAESASHTTTSVEQFHTEFRDRIRALSRAHRVLTDTRWKQVEIRTLLYAVLEPFLNAPSPRIALTGDDVSVPPRATTSLCIVFYELAANASKHGSLRAPDGRVDIEWARAVIGGAPSLEIHWTERGGPGITTPPSPGFGVTLIRGMVPHEMGGETTLQFPPEGARCLIRFPLDDPDAAPAVTVARSTSAPRVPRLAM